MSQFINLLAAFLLIVALAALALVVIVVRTRRQEQMTCAAQKGPGRAHDQASAYDEARETLGQSEEAAFFGAIVEQLGRIERVNRKQLHELTAAMVESKDWRALGEQFDALFEKRLVHLRALARRHAAVLSVGKALHHTVEAYRLSCLMLDLYEKFVAPSEVVTSVLDEWFRAHRNMSTKEFISKIHLDCARILLLNLDYAQPPRSIVLEQLVMAETCCSCMGALDSDATAQTLLAEIALRRDRLNQR